MRFIDHNTIRPPRTDDHANRAECLCVSTLHALIRYKTLANRRDRKKRREEEEKKPYKFLWHAYIQVLCWFRVFCCCCCYSFILPFLYEIFVRHFLPASEFFFPFFFCISVRSFHSFQRPLAHQPEHYWHFLLCGILVTATSLPFCVRWMLMHRACTRRIIIIMVLA